MKNKPKLDLSWYSSLVKILPDAEWLPSGCSQGETLRNERFNFQLLVHSPNMHNRMAQIRLETDLPCPVRIRQTYGVPVTFAGFPKADNDVITTENRIIPDRLKDLENSAMRIIIRRRSTLWFSVDVPANSPAGDYKIQLHFTVYPDDCDEDPTQKVETFSTTAYRLRILDHALPEQRLKVTQWLHPDCLSAWYSVPMWSEAHWHILENYIRNAAIHGMNMLLTPLFSLMLNVRQGKRRELTQLLILSRKDGRYHFDFSRFDRFIRLAQKCGIRYFEISHFFSQWGAAYAPPVEVDGALLLDGTQPGDHEEYVKILDSLLPALKIHLAELGIGSRTVFHCSDEPGKLHTERYKKAMSLLRKHLPEGQFHILDAINDAEVYARCGMDLPVPLTVQLHKFRSLKLSERWTYYCCTPVRKAANRFIHFPSSRNRILGVLLWKYGVDGFLHWGYNFYFEALSRGLVDPEKDPTSGEFYPPGDAFVVYPAPDGTADDSIRHEVFLEALQDFRALDLLAQLTGRAFVQKMLLQWAGGKLTMTEYPRGEKALLELRHKIHQAIRRAADTVSFPALDRNEVI